jgi:hypothetical protein
MPSLILQAAQSAALADGLAPPPPDPHLSGVGVGNATPVDVGSSTSAAGGGGGGNDGDAQQLAQRKAAAAMQQQASNSNGGTSNGGGGGKKKGMPLRRGKWTSEEEAYANRLIQEFKAGLLPLTDGTTLRTFLSKLLNCDPMRISKKFVGSNCIGKQVFRRRTADLNRLTPEQIQKSRVELSELERRFLERVAQTNRVKSNGVGGANGGPAGNGVASSNPAGGAAIPSSNPSAAAAAAAAAQFNMQHNGGGSNNNNNFMNMMMASGLDGMRNGDGIDFNAAMSMMGGAAGMGGGQPPSPPWMQPPLGYKQGMGAQMAASNLAGGHANSRAAAAGRALLGGLNSGHRKNSGSGHSHDNGNNNSNNASLLAMAEFQRQASRQAFMEAGSAQNLLAALGGSSSQSLAQMARNASAARLGAFAGGNSFNNLMLKTGFSRDQLSQLARERGLSSASLTNMVERKNSFDALMSLDFQSLQSIDNLANLIQTGGTGNGQAPSSGMKNWSADIGQGSNASLSNAARRLASANNLESLMRNLSNNNMSRGAGLNTEGGGLPSHANLQSLLQNMSNGNIAAAGGNVGGNTSMSSLLGGGNNGNSVASLANLLRDQSHTGLSALRMQDGLNNRNSSVEDFLSLVAAGDIPHQDPSMLNLPLAQLQQQQQQQQQFGGGGKGDQSGDGNSAAAILAQQQQALAQATGNAALANALASRSFGNFGGLSQGNLSSLGSTAELLQQMAGASSDSESFNTMKRKLLEVDGGLDSQGSNKR